MVKTKKKIKTQEELETERAEKIRLRYDEAAKTVICTICGTTVAVGDGGLENYYTQHENKRKCLKEKEKREKAAQPADKSKTLFGWLRPPAKPVQPIVSHPSSSSTFLGHTTTVPQPAVVGTDSSSPPTTTVAPSHTPPSQPTILQHQPPISPSKLVNKLRELANALPPSVREADAADRLAKLSGPPGVFDNPQASGDELWEEVLNGTLKEVLGWGHEVHPRDVIRRGKSGLDGLIRFVEYFVVTRGVDEGLFEGKLALLIEEMERMIPIPSPAHVDEALSYGDPQESKEHDSATADEAIGAELEIIAHNLEGTVSVRTYQCIGYCMNIPAGQSPHTAYPFGLHDNRDLPWDYMVRSNTMYLLSHSCKRDVSGSGTICAPCAALSRHPVVQGILDRMSQGARKGTTFAYLGFSDLIHSLNKKSEQNDFLRLNALNQTRTILRRTSMLSDYKRLVVAISSGSVARVDRIIHIALKQKRGIVAALEQVKAAVNGMYKVKSFTDQERMLATLLWRLGGDRVGHIAHRALGLPSVGTLRDGSVSMPILPCAGKPTVDTIARNTQNVLAKVIERLKESGGDIFHAVLMVDELATEKRLRYLQLTNEILGLCREHGPSLSLQFENIGDLGEVFRALDAGEVHYASEATIGALGVLCADSRIYSARILFISGDCKREGAGEHAVVLQTLLDGVNSFRLVSKIRIVSLASDGESRRGAALVKFVGPYG